MKTTLFIVVAAMAFAQPSFAQTTTVTNGQFVTAVVPTMTPTPAPAPATTTSPSINPAANTGQQSQNNGSAVNDAAGAALIAAGTPLLANQNTAPMGAALIAMGIIALAQGAADSGAANQSGQTAAASVNGSTTPSNTSTTAVNPALTSGTPGYTNPTAAQGQAALNSAGYTMTPTGLQNPDGSITPSSAFNSASGMAGAGMSPTTVAGVQKVLGDVNSNLGGKVTGVGAVEGGGGGAAGENANAAGDKDFPGFVNPFKIAADSKKDMIAGKTVLFDGDPIGVRGQNIFDMIHSSYQRQRERQNFIEEGGGVNVPVARAAAPSAVAKRSPASVTPAPTVYRKLPAAASAERSN